MMLTLLLSTASARCLVITLQDGQRLAFDITEQEVVMTHTEAQLTFNGYTIDRTNIKEFRIHAERPQDAIAVGITNIQPLSPDDAHSIHDLSGREVTHLRPGIYIINHKKIIIR